MFLAKNLTWTQKKEIREKLKSKGFTGSFRLKWDESKKMNHCFLYIKHNRKEMPTTFWQYSKPESTLSREYWKDAIEILSEYKLFK